MTSISVITGGGGIGLATAHIVGRSRPVVLVDVHKERLDAAVEDLRSHDVDATPVTCDITDADSVASLLRAAQSAGIVHSLIHTAGVSPSMTSPEAIMKINALGTVHLNEAFLRSAHQGFVSVNVASMAAHLAPQILMPTRHFHHALSDEKRFLAKMNSAVRIAPTQMRSGMAYSISKSFVIWYATTQAKRFGGRGARLLSVSPGSIDTEMGRLEERNGSAAMLKRAALKRFGTAEEVAELLAFCADDKASYLTGTDIVCDGGISGSLSARDKLSIARGSI